MTSRELIAAEAGNTDRIALYREGLFWKAYERSAYALCTQVRAFRPTRKILKTLGGGDIVSVGFPAHAADRILAGLARLDVASVATGVPAADGSVAAAASLSGDALADTAAGSGVALVGAAPAVANVSGAPAAVAAVDSSVTCISGVSSAVAPTVGSDGSARIDAIGSAASSAAGASGVAGSVSVGADACAAGSVANASAGSCAAPRVDTAGVEGDAPVAAAALAGVDGSAVVAAVGSTAFAAGASGASDPSAACMADTAASPTRMVFAAPHPIDEEAFRAWKSALPISLSIPRPAAVDTSSCDETSAASELPLHGRSLCDTALHGRSADALRPASGRAAAVDFAASDALAAVAGADFAAPASQPRLWSRLGGWLVRWATGSDASLRSDASPCADASPVAADTASPAGTAASAADILDALRRFEVADKTPMECMMFIAELKKRLLNT